MLDLTKLTDYVQHRITSRTYYPSDLVAAVARHLEVNGEHGLKPEEVAQLVKILQLISNEK